MAKQLYIDFEEYIRQGEPNQKEKASCWSIAIGLQAVDGLATSQYLQETAKKHIEGEITIDEVKQLLRSYYESISSRSSDDDDLEEADKVSANIMELLSHRTLTFSIVGITGTHEAIFKGIYKHAGKIRDYDISKKEFVLRGESVSYMEHEWLKRALEYDLQQEREFDYRGLSKDEIVKHLCDFTAGLWQIHPFREGNTRTTAVFLLQYLRSMGFEVNNDAFARHSWYFRNALVRANYSNPLKGVSRDITYLEKFFRNLLLGEQNELKNRYMIISVPTDLAITDKLTDKLGDKFSTSNENIIKLVNTIGEAEWSIKDLIVAVNLKDRESFMNSLLYPAMKEGFVQMLHPETPRHPQQRYLLTVKGIGLYQQQKKQTSSSTKQQRKTRMRR